MQPLWGPDVRISRYAAWDGVVSNNAHWVPNRFNIGRAVAHSHDMAVRNRVTSYQVGENGESKAWTFGELDRHADMASVELVVAASKDKPRRSSTAESFWRFLNAGHPHHAAADTTSENPAHLSNGFKRSAQRRRHRSGLWRCPIGVGGEAWC